MNNVMGGGLPSKLWHEVMTVAHEGKTPTALPGTMAAPLASAAGLEMLIDRLKTFRTNDAFLDEIAKAPAGS